MEWPYLTLDIEESANDDEVRKAYLAKVRKCPPEKDADGFSAIQRAYELTRSKEKRSELKLFGLPERANSLAELIPAKNSRKNVPMAVWLDELSGFKGVK